MLVGKRLVKTLTAVASNAQAPHSSHAAKRASSSSLRSLLTSNVKPIFAVHWYSTETAATEGENAAAASPAAKKKSSKTAEGGADKDIRPFNKKLRDFVNGNEFNSAKDLFEQMKKEGPKPNLVSYNVMLTCGREQKDYDYVKAVQEEMDQRFPQKKKSTRAKTAGSVSGPRSYTPKYRSGAWAILVGLLKGGTDAGIPKDDLIGAAQPYCDVSFTIPSDYNGFYTAWNSMPTLQMHGLVERLSGAAVGEAGVLYRLTEEGRNVARQLEEEDQDVRSGKKEAPAKTKRTEAAIQAGASAAAGDVITATSS